MLKVVCFKWQHKGGYKLPSSIDNQYTAEHVNRLERMVGENLTLPHEFICITDDPKGINCRTIPLWDKCRELGGCYNRLYVFSEDMRQLIGERFVCIDLDCVITGSLDKLFSREDDFVINSYKAFRKGREQHYNGGLFLMTAGARKQVWERWVDGGFEELEKVRREHMLVGTDQAWISYVLGRGECLFDEDDGVYSFRHMNKRQLPANACMVFFAGALDPSTEKGYSWIDQYYFGKEYFNTVDDTIETVNALSRNIIQETRRVHRALGYVPNIIQPRSFNEKILWLKFFRRARLKQVVADKAVVKGYVDQLKIDNVKTIPTLAVTADVDSLNFDTFERPFIVKPNHRSGAYEIVDNTYASAWPMLKRKCRTWLETRYGGFKYEWVYDAIKPQMMVEPLLRTIDGALPEDYRLFMMNGKCRMIQVNHKTTVNEYTRRCYTALWKPLDVTWGKRALADIIPKPEFLTKMKRAAEQLAKPFEFVRVDFMVVDGHLYFSEFTFFPASGCLTFNSIDFDFELGKQLTLTL